MLRRLIALLLLLPLAACGSNATSDLAPAPDRLVRLGEAEIKNLDPQLISDLMSARVSWDQFEGLTRFNGAGEAEAALAESWTISEDGLRWQFRLRSGLTFSDGTAITAPLFEKIYDRLINESVPIPNRALFDVIDDIVATGPQDVVVTLNSPFPRLPDLLAQPALAAIPLHRVEKLGERWTSERPMVTSGAYRLVEWKLNDHLRLEPSPTWHEGKPAIGSIIWRPADDALSAMRLFLAGSADIVETYPASRHGWLKTNHPETVHTTPALGSYYFTYNVRKPPFDDVRVRTALAMAVERDWIADKVMAIGNAPAWGLLPPGLTDAPYRPDWASWPRAKRLAKARALLKAAGYGPERPLEFEIRFNSSPEHRRVSVALAAMWAPLNVETKLFNSEAAIHFSALHDHDFTMARSGWIADLATPENFLSVHVPANGAGNYSGYDNPVFVKKLATAQQISDPAKRRAAMAEAEAQMIEDMPIIPLYYYVTRSLVAPRVGGWQDNVSNVHPSWSLTIGQP